MEARAIPVHVEESNRRLARLIARIPEPEPAVAKPESWRLFGWAGAIVLALGWGCYWALTR